jgi:hypothetical protein
LVIPVIAADLISFAAMHIQHALHQPLFNWFFSNRDSVLSTTRSTFVLTIENAPKAALLTAPLIWGCYFLTIYLYTAAMIVISALIETTRKSEILEMGLVLVTLRKRKRQLLLFSLSLFALLIVEAFVGYLLFLGALKVKWLAQRMGSDFGYFAGLVLNLPIVYLCTRPALKLLSSAEVPSSPANERLGTLSGFTVIVMQFVFALLIAHAAPAFFFQQTTVIGFLSREAVTSLIGASPFIPLFVAFSLLATSEEQITDPKESGLEAM